MPLELVWIALVARFPLQRRSAIGNRLDQKLRVSFFPFLLPHARVVDFPAGDEFQQGGAAFFGDFLCPLQRRHNLIGIFDSFRPAAEGAGEV